MKNLRSAPRCLVSSSCKMTSVTQPVIWLLSVLSAFNSGTLFLPVCSRSSGATAAKSLLSMTVSWRASSVVSKSVTRILGWGFLLSCAMSVLLIIGVLTVAAGLGDSTMPVDARPRSIDLALVWPSELFESPASPSLSFMAAMRLRNESWARDASGTACITSELRKASKRSITASSVPGRQWWSSHVLMQMITR